MKKKEPRPKRVRLRVAVIESVATWGNSEISFKEFQGDDYEQEVSATIEINDPWDLACIRHELNKIEAYWIKNVQVQR